MNLTLLFLLGLGLCLGLVQGANWALLIAGSSGWDNYRHQADVLHAYQLLTQRGGLPQDHVVLMMFDDIIAGPWPFPNPTPGVIINRPGGPNVYVNLDGAKDYTGANVSSWTFLNVLAGNRTAVKGMGSEKVIDSGPDDNVFVYFSDHGASGMIAMPGAIDPGVTSDELMAVLNYMTANKRFKNLVFYLESCESGSMFSGLLPNNTHIWATTAATPDQSSYACFYNDTYDTYLGDEYSTQWLNDTDVADMTAETLSTQFATMQKILQSQPQLYGDSSLAGMAIGSFLGMANRPYPPAAAEPQRFLLPAAAPRARPADAVSSRDVKLEILKRRLAKASPADAPALRAAVAAEERDRERYALVFGKFVAELFGPGRDDLLKFKHLPRDFACLKRWKRRYMQACGQFSDYGLQWVKVLTNACEEPRDAVEDEDTLFERLCAQHP